MSAPLRVLRSAVLLAAGLVHPADLLGQQVTGRVVVAAPRSSVRLGGAPERLDGLWVGGALDVRVGRFTVSGNGTRGRLTPDDARTVLEREGGEMSLSGRFDVRPWVALELRYTARALSSAAGRQRWDLVAFGASASRELGTPTVRAFAGFAFLPVVQVSGQLHPTSARSGEVGLSLTLERVPITLLLGYRVERFAFPVSRVSPITTRSEQFEAFTLSVGVRVRRLDGRWTFGGR